MSVPKNSVAIEFTNKKGENFVTYVSPEDAERVSKCNLYMFDGYVFIAGKDKNNKDFKMTLHKYMIGDRPPDVPEEWIIDHKNHDNMDNTRENLRWASLSFNAWNKIIDQPNEFRGIYQNTSGNWGAMFAQKSCGTYKTKREAGLAYAKACIKEYGELAATSDILLGDLPGKFTAEEIQILKDEIAHEIANPKVIKPRSKEGSICRFRDKFSVKYKKKYVGVYETMEEATIALNNCIEKSKKEEMDAHMAKPITYNDKGQAVIALTGKKGIGLFTVVDTKLWHVLAKGSWQYDGKYARGYWEGSVQQLHIIIYKIENPEYNGNFDWSIDHRDPSKKLDNRIDNLRVADRSQQGRNREKKKGLTSNHMGIFKTRHGWGGAVTVNKVTTRVYATTELGALIKLNAVRVRLGVEIPSSCVIKEALV